ncbi:TlpA disulfide reductase family protein [Dokdonia sp. Hel_I_53]|uniref:TlpA disulfide reductase family protein n=1 Tax=Dokdonia sp. Hel_I_53 TaxID=1566287 RepID=UPI00119B0DAF|nr:TlpA disulfide reductase family protein [Dokdonia sp. Hel_I_53]TVZ50983.1 peroxiredoxin [Dokdonia sp. Hel_I_53]
MNRIFILLLIVLVSSCSNKDTNRIKGTAVGVPEGTQIVLEELGENNKRIAIDTAIVASEKFSFDTTISDGKGLLLLSIEKNQPPLLLVKEDKPVMITLYKDSIATSLVEGSVENELFNQYRNKNRIESTKKQKLSIDMQVSQRETDGIMVNLLRKQIAALDKSSVEDKKQLVTNNPDKMVAIMALSDLVNAKKLTIEETESYFNSLSSDVQNSIIGNSVENYIAQLKSQRIASNLASVGNKAPDFTAKTPDGKELSLNEVLGKYTIIDFWASWCGPCRRENPNVVNVYNQYHDKGLNIISVSLDRPGQEERWKKAIIKDKMDWNHVSNLQFWQDPIPRKYGVRAIPATFLLDENGVIIAKDLRGPALGAKMAELLGES